MKGGKRYDGVLLLFGVMSVLCGHVGVYRSEAVSVWYIPGEIKAGDGDRINWVLGCERIGSR